MSSILYYARLKLRLEAAQLLSIALISNNARSIQAAARAARAVRDFG